MKPRPPSGVYIISVVLNRGWCAGNRGSTEWIRIGDYLNYFHKEFVISETGNIEKDVVIMRFLPKNGIVYHLNLNLHYNNGFNHPQRGFSRIEF